MIINKSSGVYRCLDRMWWEPSNNLCAYFWEAVVAIYFHVAIPVGVVLFPVLFLTEGYISLPDSVLFTLLTMTFFAVGFFLWLVGACFAAVFVGGIIISIWNEDVRYDLFHNIWGFDMEKPKPREPKPDNLMWAYMKAKKQEMCPIIEFVEE